MILVKLWTLVCMYICADNLFYSFQLLKSDEEIEDYLSIIINIAFMGMSLVALALFTFGLMGVFGWT